jgi:hypothetical protein
MSDALDNLIETELPPVQQAEIDNGATVPETYNPDEVPQESGIPAVGELPTDPQAEELPVSKENIVETKPVKSEEEVIQAIMKEQTSAPTSSVVQAPVVENGRFPVIFAAVNIPTSKFKRNVVSNPETGEELITYTPVSQKQIRRPAQEFSTSFVVKNALGQKEERTLTFNADGLYIANDEDAERLGDIAMSQAKMKVPYGGGFKTISIIKKFTQAQFQAMYQQKKVQDKESFVKSLTPEQIAAVLEAKEKGKL